MTSASINATTSLLPGSGLLNADLRRDLGVRPDPVPRGSSRNTMPKRSETPDPGDLPRTSSRRRTTTGSSSQRIPVSLEIPVPCNFQTPGSPLFPFATIPRCRLDRDRSMQPRLLGKRPERRGPGWGRRGPVRDMTVRPPSTARRLLGGGSCRRHMHGMCPFPLSYPGAWGAETGKMALCLPVEGGFARA